MRKVRRGFKWFAISLDIIFLITFHREIRGKPLGSTTLLDFVMSVRKVAMKARIRVLVFLDSSNITNIFGPKEDWKAWKKLVVKPSGLGTLYLGILVTTSSTS